MTFQIDRRTTKVVSSSTIAVSVQTLGER